MGGDGGLEQGEHVGVSDDAGGERENGSQSCHRKRKMGRG